MSTIHRKRPTACGYWWTGCGRPGCGAKPLAENVRTFELAAAAEAAGFRACLRCRPYRIAGPIGPHSPELVCRAVQLIIEGALDEGTEAALGARLAVSSRHLRRLFNDHLGVTPDQLARSRRAHFARRLLDDSELTVADVAFASGFGSLRSFNRDMREVFRASPVELRKRRRRADRLAADGGLTMRLPFQPPFDWDSIVALLAERAVPGVESVEDRVYRRTISLDGGAGVLEVHPGGADHLLLRAHLPYGEGLIHVVERAGRMVGVDADAGPAVAHLAGDPTIGTLVTARPGIRVPGAWGALEVAIHAIVAQDGDLAQARARMGTLVQNFGQPVPGLDHGLTHLFPSADVLAAGDLAATGLPPTTADAVRALAAGVAAGDVVLDSSIGLADLVDSLTAIPGIGTTAAHQVALRLGQRDAFPASDPYVRWALRALDASGPAEEITSRWQPWRAVAATHLVAYAASAPSPGSPASSGSPASASAAHVSASRR
ncbi:AlkA N-terminal domain-containing protein [Streptomyces sp. H10-C2]|uniref:DNA-3-methyladenine glycosylase 2 n=1 Tax=unclassified Streptomyces TaxID=2593676 RepID=UPI0024BAE30B|nr:MULTISPECIES: AlkA N-terminal domain-containing protein [unclassified Streptomyces]MDJ0346203.1 AlkA N-terminal domain-containing protein [Streptomyces sp. PH10-H1]MDJ0371154.1 AlkA N-terminal domain-containing protein [Streptomyces sp. H10-C2]